MRTKRDSVVLLAVVAALTLSTGAIASDFEARVRGIISQDPEAVFEENVQQGSVNWVSVPLCARSMPGFDFGGYRGPQPKPEPLLGGHGDACRMLLGDKKYQLLLELESWASEYNELVNEHRERGTK